MTVNPAFSGPMGISPAGIDRHGPYWTRQQVDKAAIVVILTGEGQGSIPNRERRMTLDINKASDITGEAVEKFSARLNDLVKVSDRFVENSKKASGSVRDATQKLADGLTKIEKAANFNRLEHYVELLERAEKAMTSLAELDSSGKLEKIAAALK